MRQSRDFLIDMASIYGVNKLIGVWRATGGAAAASGATDSGVFSLSDDVILAQENLISVGDDALVRSARPSAFARTESLSGTDSTRRAAAMVEEMSGSGWQGPPISVVETEGRLMVVDGHHRLYAARMAGIDVQYVVVEADTVIGRGMWSSLDDIVYDALTVGPDRIRP